MHRTCRISTVSRDRAFFPAHGIAPQCGPDEVVEAFDFKAFYTLLVARRLSNPTV